MDSHTAYDSKSFTESTDTVYGENNKRASDQIAAVNTFDFALGTAEYLFRADGFANYESATAAPTNYEMTDEAKASFLNVDIFDSKLEEFNDPSDVMPTTGAKNNITLKELRGLAYDDPKWEDLLDELTVADMDNLIALGGYQTYGVDSIGTMANEMNTSGWYAPAMNCHRSAFDGRNFEYYSEDGLLAGQIAAASIRGAQAHGVYAYMKHLAMNDRQISQNYMLCTWSTEQAIREIYLKPFELSVKDGQCSAVMSAWNYIGNTWAGACAPLLKTFLREEWGFQGMVITGGFHWYWYMDSDLAIRNGSDMMLKNFDMQTNHVTDQTSATSVIAMRNACHNILYTTVNSRAYADENLNPAPPAWRTAMIVVDVIVAVAVVGLAVLAIKKYRSGSQK